jgi:peptidoglycan hydrolase-like protein with peptidoglycan-binding domain
MQFNTKAGAILLVFLLGLMVIVGAVGQGVFAHAQATTAASTDACLSLPANLGYGASDFNNSNRVTALQNFLNAQGYFNSAYLGTGRYGVITLRAVVQFQTAKGIAGTGFVGPLTRAAIMQISCGTTVTPPVTTAARLYSVNPTAGAVGASVSITGFGFTSNNTVLVDGLVAARNIPITSSIAIACTTSPLCHGGINQTIVFTVPTYLSPNCPIGSLCPMFLKDVTPGTHTVSVQNDNGTSGTLTFTVTGTSTQPIY